MGDLIVAIDSETADIEIEDGQISYDFEEYEVEQNIIEGGVQYLYTIENEEASNEFELDISIEEGSVFKYNENGELYIEDENGEITTLIGSPWAVDNAGNFIDTHYEISENKIVQVVNYDGENYPLQADPLFCKDTIKSVKWNAGYDINPGDNAGSLQVVPNTCARAYIASHFTAIASSKKIVAFSTSAIFKDMKAEVKASSAYKSKITSKTAGRINDQFICHAFNPLAGLFKSSWNLEPKRRDYSLWQTYTNKCNPPKE